VPRSLTQPEVEDADEPDEPEEEPDDDADDAEPAEDPEDDSLEDFFEELDDVSLDEPDSPPLDESDDGDEAEPAEPLLPLVEPRLSVLKKPLPLNVTPTGWNTFLTGMISPEDGWAASVSVSSANDCWTSIVSPVSTNLYTYVGIASKKISSRACRSAVQ